MARNVEQLHPWMQYKVRRIQKKCKKKGLKLGIGECFRTREEQELLYAKGRTDSGAIVTNARGNSYSSQHQWGIAVDLFQNIKGREYEPAFFQKVAKIAKKEGLGWGGNWKGFQDTPHFYLKKWGSTTAQLKEQYGTFAKFKKTWRGTTTAQAALRSGKFYWSPKRAVIPAGTVLDIMWKSPRAGSVAVWYKGKKGYIRKNKIKTGL